MHDLALSLTNRPSFSGGTSKERDTGDRFNVQAKAVKTAVLAGAGDRRAIECLPRMLRDRTNEKRNTKQQNE